MKKKIAEDRVVDIVVYILLALIGIITLYPFYYTVICSFNDGLDLMKGGVYLWPRKFTLANFELFLGDKEWQHAFRGKNRSRSGSPDRLYQHLQLCAFPE